MVGDKIGRDNNRAVELVRRWEGCKLRPYLDVAGIPTIAYGAIYRLDGSRVAITDPAISQEEANALLARDVGRASSGVLRLVPAIRLSGAQTAALTDFCYNLGTGTFQHSTLRQMILAGEMKLAADQFGLYVHAGGRVIDGLVRRRAAEREVWLEAA